MMVIVCNICQSFAGMTIQSILDHNLGCKGKHDKEPVEHEGHKKAQKSHEKKKSQVMRTKGSIWVAQVRCCQVIVLSRIPLYAFSTPT